MAAVRLSALAVVSAVASASAERCYNFYSSLASSQVQAYPDNPDANAKGYVSCSLCESSSSHCNATVDGGTSQLIAGFINAAYEPVLGEAGAGVEVFMFCGSSTPGHIIPPRQLQYRETCKAYDSGKSENIGMTGDYISVAISLSDRLSDMLRNPDSYYFVFHSEASWDHWQTEDRGRVGMARGVFSTDPAVISQSSGGSPGSGGAGAVIVIVIVLVALGLLGVVLGAFRWWRHKNPNPSSAKGEDPASSSSESTSASSDLEDLVPTSAPVPHVTVMHGRSIQETGSSFARSASSRHSTAASCESVEKPWGWINHDFKAGFAEMEIVNNEMQSELQRMLNITFKNVRTRDRADGKMPSGLKLRQALRVENSAMWMRYLACKQEIAEKRQRRCTQIANYNGKVKTADMATNARLQADVNEVYLWHGTSPQGALGIVDSGFRIDMAGTSTGMMFGPGAYFAECCSKSDEYAKDDSKGIYKNLYCLLLCRVVLGETLQLTTGGEATLGMIKSAINSGSYDSVLGNREASVNTYREFVVYDERQVYPEFVLLYVHTYDQTSTGELLPVGAETLPSSTARSSPPTSAPTSVPETTFVGGTISSQGFQGGGSAISAQMLSTWRGGDLEV
eukprot:TRINITY_DN25958_c0_g1_i1.p1 TRINITY_DN25958_c0_g1~~TRINITY_DN25958_c0_g1_i1.p1  ORF type:complete len:623 (+),score=115.21 TRINITY_DN25958_c0_g1_i1:32-1900(+)